MFSFGQLILWKEQKQLSKSTINHKKSQRTRGVAISDDATYEFHCQVGTAKFFPAAPCENSERIQKIHFTPTIRYLSSNRRTVVNASLTCRKAWQAILQALRITISAENSKGDALRSI
jgi:hypothetical protein